MSNEHKKIEETEKETEKITEEKILEILQKSIEEIMNPIEDIDLKTKIEEITKNFWDKIKEIKEKKDLTTDDMIEIAKTREKLFFEKILELESIAHIDWLTGLPNLAALKEKIFPTIFRTIQRELYQKKESIYCKKLCVAMVDLDGFKNINDTCGHEEANKIIKQLANLFQIIFRPFDIIARFGGDEFSFVYSSAATNEKGLSLPSEERQKMPFLRLQNTLNTIKKNSLDELNEMPIFKGKNIDLKIFKDVFEKNILITFSVGIFQIPEEEIEKIIKEKEGLSEENITKWLIKADEALREAKKNGKNQTILYSEI
jgi:diguanylate cyclase (GGDEF)-like protein